MALALSKSEREAMEATYGWQFDIANRNQIESQWLAAREYHRTERKKEAENISQGT